MILYHEELRGTVPPFAIQPLYAPAGKHGTRIFHRVFTINQSGLLMTSGRVMIAHKGVPASTVHYGPQGKNYAIYANAFGVIYSAADIASLPDISTAPTVKEFLDGYNIIDHSHHYATPQLGFQKQLAAGAHRFEIWASAGTDADGLGETAEVGDAHSNGGMTIQLNLVVFSLASGA